MTHAMPYFSLRTQAHGDGHGLAVTDVYGREGLSQLFEFDVTLEPDASAQSLVAPREFVHGPGALCFTADGSRAVHGVIVQADFTLAQDTGRAVYRLRLVPALWRATQAVRSRVYLDMTLPQLLRAVLHETGLAEHDDYVIALTQTYRARPYTVQYNESDYEFLSRLMQEWGITQRKPRTGGPESALVVGPSSGQAEANLHTDALGRIKIQFPWDRYGQKNANSSCWVRVASAWAGNQLGAMHLPRVGQEVIVIQGPARGTQPAYSLAVEFEDSDNPRKNIHHYQLLVDGLTRVHPGGYAALFNAAIDNGVDRIVVTSCWRHVMTGNVSRVTELESYQGNAEAETVGQWEMATYTQIHRLRGIPETAKFWFHDLQGKRHHLWLSFYLRERAVSEADLSEVRAAFDELLPGRTLEDNDELPGEADMARVVVNVNEDFSRITATLVKGDVRLPLPVGKTQHFELEPFTHWPGNKTEAITPEVRHLFLYGPPA